MNIDQAHRGYHTAVDGVGYRSVNPLFMKYTPSAVDNKFCGQQGYGYRSFEEFIDAATAVNHGHRSVASYDSVLATLGMTFRTTAILEAGRMSLDQKRPVKICYEQLMEPCRPTSLQVQQ